MLHGVLDPQPGRLAFALFNGREKMFQVYEEMHPRDASMVPQFVAGQLADHGLQLKDVHRWTFGAGPGSFTFLRVVAALGAGWAVGDSQIRFRCIPGALGLAAMLDPAEGEKVGVLYDGRNKELLCFGVEKVDGILRPTGEELILNAAAAQEFFASDRRRLCAFAADEAVLTKLLGDTIRFRTVGPDLSALAQQPGDFDNDADKMCYIRPAVNA
ncbi:MAG: hypothetical protein E7053_10405 [Lentisphaerae bacterium]|nr:hypothetical protein [Lentisphaerota bacterium]